MIKINFLIIYCFTNLVNGKKYVGQTSNEKQRYNNHLSSSQNEQAAGHQYPLSRAIRKYGVDNFKFEVLAKDLNYEKANDLEIYYIELYDSIENGYNQISGGENASKPKTEEAKINMSKAKARFSDEEIIELRLAYKNKEKPSVIYKEKYSERVKYQSFYNIWCGKRYAHIMPEVFTDAGTRRVKYSEEIVLEIRKVREEQNLSYDKLSAKFDIPRPTIVDIVKRRTWKNI